MWINPPEKTFKYTVFQHYSHMKIYFFKCDEEVVFYINFISFSYRFLTPLNGIGNNHAGNRKENPLVSYPFRNIIAVNFLVRTKKGADFHLLPYTSGSCGSEIFFVFRKIFHSFFIADLIQEEYRKGSDECNECRNDAH